MVWSEGLVLGVFSAFPYMAYHRVLTDWFFPSKTTDFFFWGGDPPSAGRALKALKNYFCMLFLTSAMKWLIPPGL